MTKVETIMEEVNGLDSTELAIFRQWFLEFDAE